MVERLTKSDGRLVNAMFEVGFIGTLATGVIRVALACRRQTGLVNAIEATIIGLVLWCVMSALCRVWKS